MQSPNYFMDVVGVSTGDLVCHYLFNKSEWMALVLSAEVVKHGDRKVQIQMFPGVLLEKYFENKSTRGWVYTKWLWVLKEEKRKC